MFYKFKSKLKLVCYVYCIYPYIFINLKANDRWHKTPLLLNAIQYNALNSEMQQYNYFLIC